MASNNSALDFLQKSYNSNKSNNLQGSNKGSAGNSSLYEEDEEEKKEDSKARQIVERTLDGVTYLGHKFGLGFIDSVEGTVDYVASGVAKILESATERWGDPANAERHRDFYGRVLENDWLNYDAADEWFDPGQGWKVAGDVASGLGQQVYTWGIGLATGGVGVVPAAFVSGAGNAAQEAYKETGKFEKDEVLYSTFMGIVEGGLELVLPAGGSKIAKSIGKSLGLSIAKEATEDVVASTGKNLIKKGLKEFFSEGIEEAFTEFITPYVKRETYDEDAEDATAGEIIYSGIVGGLTALFGGGIASGLEQRSNRKAGKEIEENGSESSVLSLADMLSEIGGEVNKYTKAIQEDIAWLADSFTNKAKENRENVLENREKRQAERDEKRDAKKEKRAESFAELRERLLATKEGIEAKTEENAAKRAEEAELRKAENEAKAEENKAKSQEKIEGINNFVDGLKDKAAENREKRQAQNEANKNAALENANNLQAKVNDLIKNLESKIAEARENRAESRESISEQLDSVREQQRANIEQSLADAKKLGETLARVANKIEAKAKTAVDQKMSEAAEKVTNYLDGLKDKAKENRENVLERREERQAQMDEKKNAALENAKKLQENVNALIKKLEAKVAEGKQNVAESKESFSQIVDSVNKKLESKVAEGKESFSQMLDSVKEKQRANNEQALADAKKLGETLSRLINKIEAKAKAAAEQKINEVVEKTTEHLDNAKEKASENQSKVKDILNSGKELVNNGIEALADVADSIKNKVNDAKSKVKDANAQTRDNILKIVEALEGGAKLNWNQKRILGEIRNFETSAIFEPIIKRSALTVIESAEAVANKLNLDGVYKIVDGKLANIKQKGFDSNGKEVRDITADDIRSGINLESNASLKESITNALKNNDVLRYVAASDAAGRLMMNAKQTERAAANGSKIKTKEEFTKFLSESSKEEKNALAKELGVDDLDNITFGQFKDVVNKYINSGKAAKLQDRIKLNEQLNRMKMSKAEKMPKEINLEDGEMKHYSDANNDIVVVRKGNKYIVHDFKNNTYSTPLTKGRLDTLLGRKREISKTVKSDADALSMYDAKRQADYDKDAPLREARARIREQLLARSLREKSGALATSTPAVMSRLNTTVETKSNTDTNVAIQTDTNTVVKSNSASKIAAAAVAMRNAENIVKEKVSDYDQMDDAKKAKTIGVFKSAIKSGISSNDATSYARVAARTGLDIVFDKEACRNGNTYYAGYYDPDNNRIVVNPETTKSHAALLIHELSHAIRSYRSKDNKIHYIADKNAKITPELWQKVKKYYADQNVNVNRMELYLDEASAYYAEEILGTDVALDLLLGKKKTLKEKILSFFRGAIKRYSDDEGLSREARKFYRSFKKMFDAFEAKNQMAEANNQKADADNTKISGDMSDARFSLEFADKIAEDQRKYIKDHSQAITESELNKAITATDEMVDTMIDHKKILPEDKVGKTLVKNGSYDVSVENTTICVRTLSYNTFVDMVSEKIGRPLSQMESFLVSQKLYDIAKEPQCLYCYVSLDRKAYNDMILRYIDQRDAAIKAYEEAGRPNVTRSSKLYEDFRNKRADTDSMWDRYKGWIDAYKKGEKLLTAKDVATEARRVALVEGKDASAAAQVKDILKYAQSASWAKKQTKYVAYNGEILKLGNNVIKNLNKHYGLRWYSFSDYSGAFIVENMQQITDASLRGLKGLSYTKDTDFAKIFAPTGMNINISVYATKDGKGGYTIDEKQSANIDEAIALRKKYPNVGIVVVATDAAGVEWALNQKWSDVVIPFHTVRTGQQVAEFYDWTVFNEEQNDTVKNENLWNEYVRNVTKGDAKASKKVSKMVYPSEHQNNRETYLRLIEERGLKPRFASFHDNPNYMKLVNETRQSESQTSPLKPIYDVDAAKQSFDKFVDKGGYYEGWYNDGIDVDGEAEIVASDIRAGKKANEVDYGRQDQRGNPTPSPEAIMAQRKTKRSHGENVRFSADIEDFASSNNISWRNVAYEDSETKAKITSDIHNKMVAEGLIVKIPDEIKSKVKESYPDLQGMKKKERLPILKDSIKQLKNNLRTFLSNLKGETFEFDVDGDVLEAKLYNVGIDEVLDKVTQDKAEMLYNTEEIFKNSRYLYSTPDYDGDPNIYRWNYFYSPVLLGENIVGVRIAVRDVVNPEESQIYNWGIKKDTSLDGTGRGSGNRSSYGISSDVSYSTIIDDSAEKSNTSDENSSKKSESPNIRRSIDEEAFTSPTIGNVAKSRFDEPKPKMKEKIKVGFTSAKDKLYIETVDELYGVEKYLKKFGGRKDAEAFVQQVRASETIAQTMIGNVQYDIVSGDGTKLGEGISKIFKPYKMRKIENQFNDYLLHQLNVDRMTLRERTNGEVDNKPVFGKNEKRDHDITAEESKKIIAAYEKKYSSFKADAEKVWSYSKNLLNMRVKAGLVSQEAADLMNKYYPHYVPSFREDVKSVGSSAVKNDRQLGVNSTIKKAKGGSADIYSIEESIAAQTRQAIKAMELNKMANAVYDAAIKSGDTSYVIAEEVDTKTNTDPDTDTDVDLIAKNNQIVFFKDGKRIEMSVAKEIFDGFKGVTSGSVPDMFITRMANRGVNAFKNLVTSYSPAFSVRNFVKDIQDALINSKHVTLFGKNIVAAMKGIASNDALWQQYLAHGGYASTVFDGKGFTNGIGGRGFEALQKISEIDGNSFKKLSAAMKNILVSVGNANAFVEQVTRFAEFRASIEAGDSIQTAINNSADVTTNFSRHGKSVKVLNATFIPFLNASVQGFDKLLRVITGPFKEKSLAAIAILLAKALAIGIAPQILNMILNGDDEEYYDLTDEVRENYFLIKVGDQFLKIPRGRAAAAFGGIANRIGNEMRGDDFDVGGYLTSLKDNVTPVDSFSRNILSPFKDLATNTTWYGGEIEGRQFDNVRPSQRYDESTSSIAIWVGDKINYSPKKIHYLMDQYSGVIGDFLLPATTKKAEKDYLSANFLIDSSTNNKLSSDFYKLYDEAMYATEEGDMTAYYQLRHLNDVKESVSKLYEEINEIQNSDLKNAEKLQQVRTLRVLINNIYRTAAVDYAAYKKAIEATDGMFDDSDDSGKRDRHVAITQMMYGSEKALEEYNKGVYEKSALFNKAGISYDTYYEYYFGVRDLESDVDKNGEVVEGSKKKKVEAAIKSMGVDSRTRALLLLSSGYSVTDSEKRSIASYIQSLDLTEEEFKELAEACGFKVKNGRIQL